MPFSDEDRKRLLWHSRRGMLELDLVLLPFAEAHIADLSDEQLGSYRLLLAQEDQDLFAWFLRRERPALPELAAMVDFILARHLTYGTTRPVR